MIGREMDYAELAQEPATYNEYEDVQAYLAQCALDHFQATLNQPGQVLSPMEEAAASPAYLRSAQAMQHHLELQLAANQFPDEEINRINQQIQHDARLGRPGLLRKEYHLAERVLRQNLDLDLFYLEAIRLRLRGCKQEAHFRLDRRLQELQLQLQRYIPVSEPEHFCIAEAVPVESTFIFEDLVTLYLRSLKADKETAELSEATLNRHRSQLDLIGQLLGEQQIAALRPCHLERLWHRLENLPKQYKKIRSPSALLAFVDNPEHGHPLLTEKTRRNYRNRARQLFSFAVDEGLITSELLQD